MQRYLLHFLIAILTFSVGGILVNFCQNEIKSEKIEIAPPRIIESRVSTLSHNKDYCGLACPLNMISQQKNISLTIRDKQQIVRSILLQDDSLNRDLRTNDGTEIIQLSAENILSVPLPTIPGTSFVLIDSKQLEVKKKNGFGYYAFGRFTVEGSKVVTTFGDYFENIEGGSSSSAGTEYGCKKLNMRWDCSMVGGFGSGSGQ